mmetsp:Transcript_26271/g.55354  ORF Transcript_26271/g.55354 Transcript_26271/m.55354 type:complete len:457 (-) Transcript_26271:246-1616(-)
MGWEAIEELSLLTLQEELSALFAKEEQYASHYRSAHDVDVDDDDPTAATTDSELRRTVCQWNYDCVDYFRFDREVVFWSMNYFDRHLAECHAGLRRQQPPPGQPQPAVLSGVVTHLVALSSLYLACKLHGHMEQDAVAADAAGNGAWRPRKSILTLKEFCLMSRNTYCPQMLEEMELSILSSLRWMLHPPTTMDFLVRLVKMLMELLERESGRAGTSASGTSASGTSASCEWHVDKSWSVFEVARYQTELAVYSPELSSPRSGSSPSRVALAAVLNAMDSRIVSSSAKETVVPRTVRDAFLEKVAPRYRDAMDVEPATEPNDAVSAVNQLEIMVQRERSILKSLCSKTIVLPALVVDDASHESSSNGNVSQGHASSSASSSTPSAPSTSPADDSGGVSATASYELPEIHIYEAAATTAAVNGNSSHDGGTARRSKGKKRTGSNKGGSPVSVATELF